MDKTLKLIQQALRSDPNYSTSITEPLDILWDAYHSNAVIFDKMVELLKTTEFTG
jgi:hypothetical protein